MEEVLTGKGVLIDACPSCKGVWLDQGELNFFVKNRKILNRYEIEGLEEAHKTAHKCPKCQTGMQSGRIPGFPHQVEECLSCKGIFFDAHEFKKIQSSKEFRSLRRDSSVSLKRPIVRLADPSKTVNSERASAVGKKSAGPVNIPSLGFTTAGVCVTLYGILFALIVFLMETMKLSVLSGSVVLFSIIALQFYFAPILMDWWLKFFGSLHWVDRSHLPPFFQKSLLKISAQNRIPLPRVGIIRDGSPQAYTYGRTPYSARVVFSQGMFDLLDEGEAEAVLAHELGHIKNWDFVVMTVIKVVPLCFYMIYRSVKSALEDRDSEGKGKAGLAGALVVSYMAYLVSEYLVLFVSRVREYYADRFSCFATKNPNKLLTALVKVSYGLLSSRSPADSGDGSHEDKIKGMEALNIMSVSRSKQMALASQGEADHFNPEVIQEIMRWDLWSPWAFFYELNSTHPLTAKRINAIGSHALSMGQEPFLLFKKEKPESYWDDFFIDVLILFLPYILAVGGVLSFLWFAGWDFGSLNPENILPFKEGAEQGLQKPAMGYGPLGFGLLGLSIGALIRLVCSYPYGRFMSHSVSSLLKLIKVSPVRSYPVTLQGRILGRGEAGNIFSEDFVLKDQTGMLYLNHEPFGLNILFALFRYKKFQGKNVTVQGWYRRSPSPYLEVKFIQVADTKSWAYTYYYKLLFCLLGLILSVFCFVL